MMLVMSAAWISFAVQAGTITQQYSWEYFGRTWSLTHQFAGDRVVLFQSLPRVSSYTEYATYVNDPRDDAELGSLVGALEEMAYAARLNVWEKLNLVVAFVQSIRYVSDEGEYPRYPLETLVEKSGDCEDMAILAASLIGEMGFGAVLLAFTNERHMALGIRVLPPTAGVHQAYEYNGDLYYYLELTGTGWAIGSIPDGYTSVPKIIALPGR